MSNLTAQVQTLNFFGTWRLSKLRTWRGWRIRYLAIGGGSMSFSTSFGFPAHLKGRWTTPPGSEIETSAANVACSTAFCVSASPGSPTVCPKGRSIPAIRGALTADTRSGMFARVMVQKPAASILRCTSPTDQLQIGQAGTNTTTLTVSSLRFWMIAGVVSSSRILGCRL